MTRRGFPHSDIPGSKVVCTSPRLIAAYRVLHRLLAPRHSPYALSSLTIGFRIWRRPTTPRGVACLHQIPFQRPQSRTHCLFVVRKKLPFAGYSVVEDHGRLDLRSPPGAAFRLRPVSLPGRARHVRAASRVEVVENTGLEPVTSWLQTRRSPS